jgi:hypothetical protein
MATLGFGLIIYRIVLGTGFLGEADGITGVPGFPMFGLEGPEPGVELLCGKLIPEYFKTLMPHTVWHDSLLPITLKCL